MTKIPIKKQRAKSEKLKVQWHLHHKLAWVVAIGAVLALGISSLPKLISAWGPSRTTYTIAQIKDNILGDKIAINSIVDSDGYGDERGFVNIRDAACTIPNSGCWKHNITVEEGHTYWVRMYVHNNSPLGTKKIATGVKATAAIDTTIGTSQYITGYIDTDNAIKKEVWDDVKLSAGSDFNIAYIPGSGEYFNNWTKTHDFTGQSSHGYAPLSDSLFGRDGVKLGYDKYNAGTKEFDGKIPGCYEYSGYVYFQVKPQFRLAATTDFSADKWVRKAGETEWQKSITAENGDKLEYQIKYKNESNILQKDIVIKDILPSGIDYKANSAQLKHGVDPVVNLIDNDTVIVTTGENIGDYNPAAAGYVKFEATVNASDEELCYSNHLLNKAYVWTDYGLKIVDAEVVLPEIDPSKCEPEPPVPPTPECVPGDAQCPLPDPDDTPAPKTIANTGAGLSVALVAVVVAVVVWHHYYVIQNKLKKPAHTRKKRSSKSPAKKPVRRSGKQVGRKAVSRTVTKKRR